VRLAAVALVSIVLQTRVSLKRGLVAVALLVILTVVVAATLPEGYTQAVTSKYSNLTSTPIANVATNRGAAWEAGLRAIEDNPLMGSGLSTATVQRAIASHYVQATITNKAAHNMYIAMGVGTGVPGLIAFLALVAIGLSGLWSTHLKAVKAGRKEVQLAAACLLTAIVVTLTQGLQLDLQMEKYLWLLLGAALAVRYWPVGPLEPSLAESRNG
jgi:O-antigen ligase